MREQTGEQQSVVKLTLYKASVLIKGGSLTAGWSIPRVFSLIANASFSRFAASLYLFWSL